MGDFPHGNTSLSAPLPQYKLPGFPRPLIVVSPARRSLCGSSACIHRRMAVADVDQMDVVEGASGGCSWFSLGTFMCVLACVHAHVGAVDGFEFGHVRGAVAGTPPPPRAADCLPPLFPSSRRTESRMVRPKECIRLYGPVTHCDTSTQTQLEGVAVFHAPSSSATHRY